MNKTLIRPVLIEINNTSQSSNENVHVSEVTELTLQANGISRMEKPLPYTIG